MMGATLPLLVARLNVTRLRDQNLRKHRVMESSSSMVAGEVQLLTFVPKGQRVNGSRVLGLHQRTAAFREGRRWRREVSPGFSIVSS